MRSTCYRALTALVISLSLHSTGAFHAVQQQQQSPSTTVLQKGAALGLATPDRVRDINFAAPLRDEGYPRVVEEHETGFHKKKPLLLYLPGFDGMWLTAFLQFPELSTVFDVRCLTMSMNDRSTFDELKSDVIDFIYNETQLGYEADPAHVVNETGVEVGEVRRPKGILGNVLPFRSGAQASKETTRPVYLMGESFGGILASEVAMTLLQEQNFKDLKGLVVINAATCYDRSRLAFEGTQLIRLPKLFYPFGLLRILPLFADEYSCDQLLLILRSKALPSVIDSPEREAFMGRVAFSLPQKLKYMTQETLEWRLTQWLEKGSARVEPKLMTLSSIKDFRTLIVAGEKDLTLPSIAEAERLSNIFPNSRVHVVEGAGHSSTCGSRVDLTALMRGRFEELKMRGKRGKRIGRTSMKTEAAMGEGVHFGLERRYNGKEEGLSPLLYWSKHLYRKPPAEN